MARNTRWLGLMTMSLWLVISAAQGCVLYHDVDAMAGDGGTGGMSSNSGGATNSGGSSNANSGMSFSSSTSLSRSSDM